MPKRVDCNTWLNCWITSLKSPPNEREIALFVGVFVRGYTRKDGTVVPGHYRSAPNGTNRDNFSTRGNTNPYTREKGKN
jgi:hypothetical protein